MSRRRGRQKSSEKPASDSEIDYTFDENSENPFVPKPRITKSPILTRARARAGIIISLDSINDSSDRPYSSEHRIAKNPLVTQIIEGNLQSSLQVGESTANMDDENGANGLPSGPRPIPSSTGNDLNVLTSRLERVLTLNHDFMGEISNLRQSLLDGFSRNSASYNQFQRNLNNPGNNRNDATNPSFHNQSTNSNSSGGNYLSDLVRMDKWNITYDGSDDVSDFLFKVDTLKTRYCCSDDYISSNFHTLLKGKADTWFWSFLKQHPNSKYDEIKFALTKQYGKIENDCDKIVRMIERRQMPKESFDDYFSEMIAMNSRLSQPMNETKMIELMKNNVKESLGSLLFATDLFSLDHLRDSARRAEKYVLRKQQIRFQNKHISEIESGNNIEALVDGEEEVAAFRYQGSRSKERKDLDTRHFKCWNCDQIGHSFYDCPSEKRNLFCFRCGEKNVTTPQCKNHSKNGNQNE